MKRILSAAAFTLLAAPAFANNDSGIYIGIAAGQADAGLNEADFASVDDGSLSGETLDKKDTFKGLMVGYGFNDYFGAELGLVNVGTATQDATSDGTGTAYTAGPVKATLEVEGWTFSALGKLPVTDDLTVYGRAGIFSWDATAAISNNSAYGSAKTSGSDPFVGIGVRYDLDQVFFGAEYTRYDIDSYDVDVLSAHVAYKF